MFNWPNVFTLVRIAVIPLLVIVFYLPVSWAHLVAAFIFIIAAITDWLDGYLARYLKQSTLLGAFLDPVADKLIVLIALVLIVAEPVFRQVNTATLSIHIPAALMTIPAAIIVGRELIVSALREWMAEIGKRASIAVSNFGKIKTIIQMIALIILLYCNTKTSVWLIMLGYILLYIAAILTIWSMLLYLKAAWPELISHPEMQDERENCKIR